MITGDGVITEPKGLGREGRGGIGFARGKGLMRGGGVREWKTKGKI